MESIKFSNKDFSKIFNSLLELSNHAESGYVENIHCNIHRQDNGKAITEVYGTITDQWFDYHQHITEISNRHFNVTFSLNIMNRLYDIYEEMDEFCFEDQHILDDVEIVYKKNKIMKIVFYTHFDGWNYEHTYTI